jgi:hypothetical protein
MAERRGSLGGWRLLRWVWLKIFSRCSRSCVIRSVEKCCHPGKSLPDSERLFSGSFFSQMMTGITKNQRQNVWNIWKADQIYKRASCDCLFDLWKPPPSTESHFEWNRHPSLVVSSEKVNVKSNCHDFLNVPIFNFSFEDTFIPELRRCRETFGGPGWFWETIVLRIDRKSTRLNSSHSW